MPEEKSVMHPYLLDLVKQIPADEQIGSVPADGAYDTRKGHEAIAAGISAAIIPPRKNVRPCTSTSPGAVTRNDALRVIRNLGRAIWRRWSGYHRRSRGGSKMNCIKLLGKNPMARDFERKVAEIRIRVALFNRHTALGIPVTEAEGYIRQQKGQLSSGPGLCNKAAGTRKRFFPRKGSRRRAALLAGRPAVTVRERLGDRSQKVGALDRFHQADILRPQAIAMHGRFIGIA